MSNSTCELTYDVPPYTFKCNENYKPPQEIAKYVGQAVYLLLGSILNVFLFCTFRVKDAKIYGASAFFYVYSLDCILNLVLILLELAATRLFIFVIPLCSILAQHSFDPMILFEVLLIAIHYAKLCKCLTQIGMVLNRMFCVLRPTDYIAVSKKWTRYMIAAILIIPLIAQWFSTDFHVCLIQAYGGFTTELSKRFSWGNQSIIQIAFIIGALLITAICSTITGYKLHVSTGDLTVGYAEETVTTTTLYMSGCFAMVAVFQILYNFLPIQFRNAIFFLNLISNDVLLIGCPLLMLWTHKKIRDNFENPMTNNSTAPRTSHHSRPRGNRIEPDGRSRYI